MQCPKCNHKWNLLDSDESSIDKCPKCYEPIAPNYKNFNSIIEGIYYCIYKGSNDKYDILKNKTKLNSYFADVLGTTYPEYNLIKMAVSSDIGNVLYDAISRSDKEKNEAYSIAVEQMIREYSTERVKAEEVIRYFTQALGWQITTINIPTISTKDEINKNNETDKAIEKFERITPIHSIDMYNENSSLIENNKEHQKDKLNNTKSLKKKKMSLLWRSIILLFLILTLAIIGLFLIKDKRTSSKQDSQQIVNQNTTDVNITEPTPTTTVESFTIEPVSTTTLSITTTEITTTETSVITTTTEISQEIIFDTTSPRKIRNLTDNTNTEYFQYQYYAIDLDDNILYYISNEIIYKVDITTGEQSIVKEFTAEDNVFHPRNLVYNQYDGNVYCIAKKGLYSAVLFDVNSETYIALPDYGDLYSFLSSNTLSILYKGWNNNNVKKCSIIDGEVLVSGYVKNDFSPNELDIQMPFLFDELYYWLGHNYQTKTANIIYTLQHCSNDYVTCGETIAELPCIATNILNDNVFIMQKDYSIYKVNIDKLLEIHNASKNDTDENLISGNKEADYDDALELVLNGALIKQTGLNNLNDIGYFSITNNGSIIVYDKFDTTYKIIEIEK